MTENKPVIIAPHAIITADPVTSAVNCTYDRAVVVDNGVITDVGDTAAITAKYPDTEVKRFSRSLLTPGFINGHHHIGVTPVQLGVPDSSLETWISRRAAPPVLDIGLDTTYAAAQMIRSGITTVQHLQAWYPADADDLTASASAALDAYARIGMRGSLAKMIRDQNFFIHGDNDMILARLPAKHRDRFAGILKGLRVPLDEQLATFTDLRAAYQGNPLLAVQLGPMNFHWLSDEALEKFAQLSASTGTLMHMHFLETIYQSMYLDRRTGASRARYLAKSGLLSNRLTLGHGTWLQQADIEVLADAGTSVCNNCSSNFRLSSGRLPLLDMLDASVNVGMGIDEAGINDDHDMLAEMKLVYIVNREPGLTRRRVSAEQVFTMATLGGARTTGYGEGHGTITPGAPADLVLFDEARLYHPFQLPGVSEVELIVQRGRRDSITDVMIGGAWVMVGSKLTTIDEAAVDDELVRARAAINPDEHRANQEFATGLTAAVRAWFVQEYGL